MGAALKLEKSVNWKSAAKRSKSAMAAAGLRQGAAGCETVRRCDKSDRERTDRTEMRGRNMKRNEMKCGGQRSKDVRSVVKFAARAGYCVLRGQVKLSGRAAAALAL